MHLKLSIVQCSICYYLQDKRCGEFAEQIAFGTMFSSDNCISACCFDEQVSKRTARGTIQTAVYTMSVWNHSNASCPMYNLSYMYIFLYAYIYIKKVLGTHARFNIEYKSKCVSLTLCLSLALRRKEMLWFFHSNECSLCWEQHEAFKQYPHMEHLLWYHTTHYISHCTTEISQARGICHSRKEEKKKQLTHTRCNEDWILIHLLVPLYFTSRRCISFFQFYKHKCYFLSCCKKKNVPNLAKKGDRKRKMIKKALT